jgi:hypothetical protein
LIVASSCILIHGPTVPTVPLPAFPFPTPMLEITAGGIGETDTTGMSGITSDIVHICISLCVAVNTEDSEDDDEDVNDKDKVEDDDEDDEKDDDEDASDDVTAAGNDNGDGKGG